MQLVELSGFQSSYFHEKILDVDLCLKMKAYWYDNKPVSLESHSCLEMQLPSLEVEKLGLELIWADDDFSQGDQREAHDSGREVAESYLASLGVFYRRCPTIEDVHAIAKERGYKNSDQIVVSPQTLGDVYEEKVKSFFAEHLHEDEEIRYIADGEGFFDVRGKDDEWVRIRLVKEDLVILPAGIYHRFTTDDKNVGYMIALRLLSVLM